MKKNCIKPDLWKSTTMEGLKQMRFNYCIRLTHPEVDKEATQRAFEELREDVIEVDAFYEALEYVSNFVDLSLSDKDYWEKRDEYVKMLMKDDKVPEVGFPCWGSIHKSGRGKITYFKWSRKEDVVRWLIALCVVNDLA